MDKILKPDYSATSEKTLERRLVREVKELGGLPLKYQNSNMTGYPDRLIVLPRGDTVWVELKSAGKNPSKLQAHCISRLRELGCEVYLIDTQQKLSDLLEYLKIKIKTIKRIRKCTSYLTNINNEPSDG